MPDGLRGDHLHIWPRGSSRRLLGRLSAFPALGVVVTGSARAVAGGPSGDRLRELSPRPVLFRLRLDRLPKWIGASSGAGAPGLVLGSPPGIAPATVRRSSARALPVSMWRGRSAARPPGRRPRLRLPWIGTAKMPGPGPFFRARKARFEILVRYVYMHMRFRGRPGRRIWSKIGKFEKGRGARVASLFNFA